MNVYLHCEGNNNQLWVVVVVSVHAFYSDDPSSNLAEAYSFFL